MCSTWLWHCKGIGNLPTCLSWAMNNERHYSLPNNESLVKYNCLIFTAQIWNTITLAALQICDEIKIIGSRNVEKILIIEQLYGRSHGIFWLFRLISGQQKLSTFNALWPTLSPGHLAKPLGLLVHIQDEKKICIKCQPVRIVRTWIKRSRWRGWKTIVRKWNIVSSTRNLRRFLCFLFVGWCFSFLHYT